MPWKNILLQICGYSSFPLCLLMIVIGIDLGVYYVNAEPEAKTYSTISCYCFSCTNDFVLMYNYTIPKISKYKILTVDSTSCADYLKSVPCYYYNIDVNTNTTAMIGDPPSYNAFFIGFNLVTLTLIFLCFIMCYDMMFDD